MKTIKRIICIFLALIFALLAGCKDNSLPVDRVVAETDTHRVFYSNEKCYIEFFEDLDYQNDSPIMASVRAPSVDVQNAEELVDKILKNDFTFAQKRMIYRATTDENGKIDRCIFDIEKMYQPVFSDEAKVEKLIWTGFPSYFYIIRYADGFRVNITYYEKDYYTEIYQRDVTDEIAELEASDSYTVTQLNDKNAVEYRGKSRKFVIYDIEKDGKNITVKEEYHISDIYGDVVSETVPCNIDVYVTEDNLCYKVRVTDCYRLFDEHPGEEWLLSFGMEPYVPAGE